MAEQGSMIERLRAERAAALKREKTLTLEVPGWSGLLHVRYKPVDWERIFALLQTADELDAAATLRSNIDGLSAACDALLVKDDEGELVSLADTLREQGETVHGEVRFDATAAEVLDLKVKNAVGDEKVPEDAAEVCLALFAGAVSPELAITGHAGSLGAHMSGVSAQVDEGLAGK